MSDGSSEFGWRYAIRCRIAAGGGPSSNADSMHAAAGTSDAGRQSTQGSNSVRRPVECSSAALSGSQRASKASEARKQCRAGSSGLGRCAR